MARSIGGPTKLFYCGAERKTDEGGVGVLDMKRVSDRTHGQLRGFVEGFHQISAKAAKTWSLEAVISTAAFTVR